MTIEERLERLTDRHEALTQSVEMLLTAQRETEKHLGQLGQFIDSLARIAEAHEHRIDRLEEGNEK